MTTEERTTRLGLCLTEVKSLCQTAEALHSALAQGDTEGVRQLSMAQEMSIFRVGRLLDPAAPAPGPRLGLPGQGACKEASPAVTADLREELGRLAEISKSNARLLEDGIRTSRTLLRMLTGQPAARTQWTAEDGRARLFSRQG